MLESYPMSLLSGYNTTKLRFLRLSAILRLSALTNMPFPNTFMFGKSVYFATSFPWGDVDVDHNVLPYGKQLHHVVHLCTCRYPVIHYWSGFSPEWWVW